MRSFWKAAFFGLALMMAMMIPMSMSSIASAGSTGSVQVYGHIEALTPYHITYDANGGTGSFIGPDIEPNGTDTVATLSDTGITRDGHKFTGWNTAGDGSGASYAPGDSIKLESEITLYAQWEEDPPVVDDVTYNITYDANGGTGSFEGPEIDPGGTDTVSSLSETGIARDGYKFTGWNTNADGSGTSYVSGDSITLDSDVTLYAQWKKNSSDTGNGDGKGGSNSGGGSTSTKSSTPKTGDDSNVEFLFLLLGLSAFVILLCLKVRRDDDEKTQMQLQ